QKGEYELALDIFHHAEHLEPDNRHILYGIALVLFHQMEFSSSSEYLDKIIDRNIDDEFDERSKNLQREIAGKTFQKNGLRMDAVHYCLAALEKYNEMSFTEIQGINYEISMLGRTGLDPSNPKNTYQLTCIPGDFTALQLLCYMYVGFKLVNPDIDIGFDLSKEYSAAKAMYSSQNGC
ncbi:MAG: tetratricopeptide repeat protein, partial [Bacteroidota bacterium]